MKRRLEIVLAISMSLPGLIVGVLGVASAFERHKGPNTPVMADVRPVGVPTDNPDIFEIRLNTRSVILRYIIITDPEPTRLPMLGGESLLGGFASQYDQWCSGDSVRAEAVWLATPALPRPSLIAWGSGAGTRDGTSPVGQRARN